MKITAALLLLAALACGRQETSDERCRRTIDHVKAVIAAAQVKAPGRGRRFAGGAAEIASMSVCTHEGLSPEQADCITGAGTIDELMEVGSCPAIRAKRPRWLVLPPRRLFRSEPEAGEQPQPGK
jgi:hypothetical protein